MTSLAPSRWHTVAEKGSLLGIRLLVFLAFALGRPVTRVVLRLVAWWYVLLHPGVRAASIAYLRRLGAPAGLLDAWHHVFCFAQVTLDRAYFARGRFEPFQIAFHGEEHLRALLAARRGAILILAHVGSFEVMRASSEARSLPVNMLRYFRNARMIQTILRQLNPLIETRVIEIRPNDFSFIFEVEARVSAGELLGTMGDRTGLTGKDVRVPFLGAEAFFPTGPYLLASLLGCPVYLAFGLFTQPNRYDLHCEPFAERIAPPRGRRDQALAEHAARYALRLEHYCRLAPHNWFNFCDFWSPSP